MLVRLALAHDDRAAPDRVGERPGLDVGHLRPEVVVQGQLGPRFDHDAAEDQGPIWCPLDVAGLGQGVADSPGRGLRLPKRAGQHRAEGRCASQCQKDQQTGAE